MAATEHEHRLTRANSEILAEMHRLKEKHKAQQRILRDWFYLFDQRREHADDAVLQLLDMTAVSLRADE